MNIFSEGNRSFASISLSRPISRTNKPINMPPSPNLPPSPNDAQSVLFELSSSWGRTSHRPYQRLPAQTCWILFDRFGHIRAAFSRLSRRASIIETRNPSSRLRERECDSIMAYWSAIRLSLSLPGWKQYTGLHQSRKKTRASSRKWPPESSGAGLSCWWNFQFASLVQNSILAKPPGHDHMLPSVCVKLANDVDPSSAQQHAGQVCGWIESSSSLRALSERTDGRSASRISGLLVWLTIVFVHPLLLTM